MGLLFDSYLLDALVALATLAYVLYVYYKSIYSYWEVRGVPHVKAKLFSGVILDQIFGRKNLGEVHMDMYKEAPADASVVGYYETTQPKLMIRDPELAEKVLIKDFASFHDRGFPIDLEDNPLSGHLFIVEGAYWRNLRYKLSPVFTSGKLKAMVEQMGICADNLVRHIETQSENNSDRSFEGKDLVNLMSIDVIGSCAFGLDLSNNSEQGRLYRQMTRDLFTPSRKQILSFSIVTLFPKLARLLKIKGIPREIEDYYINIIKETVRYRRENNIKRNDFLQMMMTLQDKEHDNIVCDEIGEVDPVINQLENVPILDNNVCTTNIFTDACLAAQSFVFLAAGSDPVSIVCSFCMYALATNSDVQEKLQQEVDAVLENHNGKWTYEAVKDMKYLDQVINETHRRFSTVPVLFRKCNQAFQIPDTKYVVEPGTRITIPTGCFHHDEKYFPDPLKFDPERFAEGNSVQKNVYLPFGDGPRICIGMRFAQLEIKVCIAHIVSAFNIRVSKKTIQPLQFQPLSPNLLVKGGLWLEFDKRVKA